MNKYIAFDIGGTNVKHGIVNEIGEVLEKGQYSINVDTLEKFIDDLVNVINEYRRKVDVQGIGISMPGIIDPYMGGPSICYAIRVAENQSITKILEEKTGLKVSVENDGNCVALAEKFNGNAQECNNFICVTVGTGIGGGLFLNNKLYRGNFTAGEFGYMINNGLSDKNKGYQTYSENASTISLVRRYKEYKNIPNDVNVEGEEVFNAAKSDDKVKAIIDEWYKCIAYGILNVTSLLSPDKVLIGGGISQREDFIENINKALDEIPWWSDIKTKVEKCKHMNDAGMVGAIYNFKNPS